MKRVTNKDKQDKLKVTEAIITYEKVDGKKVTSCLNLTIYSPAKPRRRGLRMGELTPKDMMGYTAEIVSGDSASFKLPLGCKLEYSKDTLHNVIKVLELVSESDSFDYFLQVAFLEIFTLVCSDFSYDNKQIQMAFENLINSKEYHSLKCFMDTYNDCVILAPDDLHIREALGINGMGRLDRSMMNRSSYLRHISDCNNYSLLKSEWVSEEPIMGMAELTDMYMQGWLRTTSRHMDVNQERDYFIEQHGESLVNIFDSYHEVKAS